MVYGILYFSLPIAVVETFPLLVVDLAYLLFYFSLPLLPVFFCDTEKPDSHPLPPYR